MKRSSLSSILHHEPIYREVLKHAFHTAWHDRQYWLLAILAGILVTGGSYDVLWRAVTTITDEGRYLSLPIGENVVAALSRNGMSGFDGVISAIGGVQMLLVLAGIMLAVGALSCMGQGGLVYALGARRRKEDVRLLDALRVGGRLLWPIIALNTMAFALIWVLRFLAALPLYLALEQTTAATYLVFMISFGVFVLLSLIVAVIQIFALNGIVLQGASAADAIRRGYMTFKKHWVVVVETAVLQVVLTVAIWFAVMVGFLILMVPIFLLALIASAVQSSAIIGIAFVVGSLTLVIGLLGAAAFTIQLQYATWTYLFRRLGEGGVVPKLHRLAHSMTGFFNTPRT
ncbi:MAG: hypothetical protein WC787_01960 [Patescibacteria group bacterium]|jgi:hypothetical protein